MGLYKRDFVFFMIKLACVLTAPHGHAAWAACTAAHSAVTKLQLFFARFAFLARYLLQAAR